MTDAQKQQQEELELKALEILKMYFVDLYQASQRRKKLRKISTEEMPWRAQFNIVHGLSQFGVFLGKLDTREKVTGVSFSYLYRTSNLEEEWFSLETAGTLVVEWSGGPSRQHTRQGPEDIVKESKMTGIELAAAAATGKNPPPQYPLPREEDDTPRTYRSEAETYRQHHGHGNAKHGKGKKVKEDDPESMLLSTPAAINMLKHTFKYLKKAVVLAHRGQHWLLLQNACRALWNTAHTALTRSRCPTKRSEHFLDMKSLRNIMWDAFWAAADCLLEMLSHLQQEVDKRGKGKKDKETDTTSEQSLVRSWMGNILDETGGAGLKFDHPLDDRSVVDVRWMKRVILRTLELLYYEQKWERLVDLALRFNAISDDRYAEQVNPLLVQAQRKLHVRVENSGGPSPPQPHFMVAMEHNQPITAQRYASMQIEVQCSKEDMSEIAPGAQLDPEGMDVYGGGERALKLCSVPLDVGYSLKNLRQALDKSNYSARALQHSRRLLILYLAGQTNSDQALLGYSTSRVDFVPNTAKPQPTMPPDISKETYSTMDDVQTSPLPKSQINVVISSYDKTIEMLLAGGHKSLAAEAMRELANLHYHMGNLRNAYKWWSESLDMLLDMSDAIHQWRTSLGRGEDISKVLLDKCGLWGCVLGGVLASNIAQYVLNADLGLRTECCFLSSFFFKALFRAALPHPTSDKDYALYEVGEGCEVTNLLPGIDLLSERFRCDGRTLIAAIRFILDELSRGHHHLFMLPLLTLYLHLTTFVCRDLERTVEGRILKVRVLTDLHFFTEACINLQRLLVGDRLPHAADATFRQTEGKMSTTRFNMAKPLLEPCNLKVIETVIDKRLSTLLSSVYGPHLTCLLSISQAHLMVTLADTIPALPKFEDIAPPGTSSLVQAPPPAPTGKNSRRKSVSPVKSLVPKSDDSQLASETKSQMTSEEETSTVNQANKRFTEGRKPVNLDVIKGTLLATADQMLATLSEIVSENALNNKGLSAMSASELELVVRCKLEMAFIARQRHHSALAARVLLSALKLLQGSQVFTETRDMLPTKRISALRKEKEKQAQVSRDPSPKKYVELDTTQQYQYQNFQSRSRLDTRLWLSCYLALVESLTGEIRGMGQVKGPERMVKVELAEVRQYCAEGITVAETCGDIETQAHLLYHAVVLNTIDGRPVANSVILLQDILKLLSSLQQVSPISQLLQARVLTHLTDLEVIMAETGSDNTGSLKTNIKKYQLVHDMILQQLEKLGEEIEHRYDGQKEYSTPVSPISNLYQPHLLLLVQLKQRIGYTMARRLTKVVKNSPADLACRQWSEPLGVLTTALEMCKVIAQRVPTVEAEIMLNIGKIQRQLYHLGKVHHRLAADTLINAIKMSFSNDHDVSLMRQAYLEIGLIYLASSGQVLVREGSILEPVPDSEDDLSSISRESIKKKKRVQRKKSKKLLPEDDKDREKRAAWVAIRCATILGQAQRSRAQLQGDAKITSLPLGDKPKSDLPDFMVLDLLGSYVLGEKKRVYKNEIEEELASLTEELEPPPIETYDDQLNKAKDMAVELNWIHVIGYQTILQRLCSTSTMSTKKQTSDEQDQEPDVEQKEDSNNLDLDFLNQSQFDISINQDVVRSVLFSVPWSLRLSYLHKFLVTHLSSYASECTSIYPPASLHLPIPSDIEKPMNIDIITKFYSANTVIPLDIQPEATMTSIATTIVPDVIFRRSDQKIVNPADSELCCQWYLPVMDEHVITVQPADTEEEVTQPLRKERQVMLLYALWHKKTEKQSCRMAWVPLSGLLELHDRLNVLTQRAEISLTDSPKQSPKKEATPAPGKGKKQARIKALSPRVKKDELLEALLKQCMADAQTLVGYNPEPEELPESAPQTAPGSASTATQPTIQSVPEEGAEQPKEQPATERKTPIREKTSALLAAEEQQPEIPFDVTKANVNRFEKLYDPSLGSSVSDVKMLKWFMTFYP